ncbi:MAG: GntR family transcriptional regulator [Chloroflexota bacterium]|nr:MAG: GntR family transcriptional regulator [Chloroflexota bacterium]
MEFTQGTSTPYAFSIPLYVQLAEGLIAKIESGELSPGEQLPPERELSASLGVNRMTLRRALHVLESQGMIIRKHGVGTFIAEPKIDRQMEVVFRFTSGMLNQGFTPGAEMISFEEINADQILAKDLAIPTSSRVYSILRLRSINREPVMIESYKIPVQRFLGLDRFDLESRSIYEIMEIEYGIPINRARQSFEPITATSFEAELLNINYGEALMLERRISYDDINQPVEYGKDRYRGDRFRFVTEAKPFPL